MRRRVPRAVLGWLGLGVVLGWATLWIWAGGAAASDVVAAAPPSTSPAVPVKGSLPVPLKPAPPVDQTAAALKTLNGLRTLAKLPGVKGEPAWAAECAAHARYMVLTDRGEHGQDPSSPHSSQAGAACAAGHYFVSSQPESGADRALRYWATGAFHLPQLLDPRLTRVAFGLAHDDRGAVQTAAALDVRRGLRGRAAYPVRFPAPGTNSPLSTASSFEWPDPLAGCKGYAHPIGAPIALLLGPGKEVRRAAIKVNGRAVAACLLTARSFRGSSEGDTRVGRGVLAAQGTAVLLPRLPLPAGAVVRVSFGTVAGPVSWSFRVR